MKNTYPPVLIIGCGLSGLTVALEVAKKKQVVLMTKDDPSLSATAWAQGGIVHLTKEEKSIKTHINDTVNICYLAWKKNLSKHYSITNRKSLTILDVAKMFKSKILYLPARKGERYASALTKMNLFNKVEKKYGKIQLKTYIDEFLKKC